MNSQCLCSVSQHIGSGCALHLSMKGPDNKSETLTGSNWLRQFYVV